MLDKKARCDILFKEQSCIELNLERKMAMKNRTGYRTSTAKNFNFDAVADRAAYRNWAREQTETAPIRPPVVLTLAELGFPNGATGEQILAKSKEMGYRFLSVRK